MPAVNFPSSAGNPVAAGILALAKVYIGAINTNPRVLGNRVNVTVTQQNGTPVVIAPAAQPFILNAGGFFEYGGNVVKLQTDAAYAMAVDTSQEVQAYYLPNSSSGDTTNTSSVNLDPLAGSPTPIPGQGIVYTMDVSGIVELFYMDSEGQIIQITTNGSLNVDLPDAVLTLLGVASDYYLGAAQELTITGGEIEIDWQGGQYFSYTNTEAHTITFSNVPLIGEGYGQTIMLAIQDAGNFAIMLDPSLGYTVYRRSADNLGDLTVDGLDLLICTVYSSGIVTVVPLLDFVPNV